MILFTSGQLGWDVIGDFVADICQVCGEILVGNQIKKAEDSEGESWGTFCPRHARQMVRRGLMSRKH